MEKEILELLIEMNSDIKSIKMQVKENTQILKGLAHSAQVNEAEHNNLTHEIASLSRTVESIKKDISNVEVITASNWLDIAKLKSNTKRA